VTPLNLLRRIFQVLTSAAKKSLSGKRKILKVTKTVAHAVCERKGKERGSAENHERVAKVLPISHENWSGNEGKG